VAVEEIYVDPITYQVYSCSPTIPFSGILAMTFPARSAFYPAPTATLGNILVETPNGDITANTGGILQVPLNNLNYRMPPPRFWRDMNCATAWATP